MISNSLPEYLGSDDEPPSAPNPPVGGYPPNLGQRSKGEDVDEVAVRLYETLCFWFAPKHRELLRAAMAASDSTFEVVLASNLAGTIRNHFEVSLRNHERERNTPWYKKLWKALRRAFWTMRYWYV